MPVLAALVRAFDESVRPMSMQVDDVAKATGMSEDDVLRALRGLGTASPPYVEGHPSLDYPFPVTVTRVTERARREVGQWPSADALAERLLAALEAAAEREPDEEKRSRLRQALNVLGGVGREILTNAAGSALGGVVS